MSEQGRKFVMPPGAFCDVRGCGKPATRALIATENPGHFYLCDIHHDAVVHKGFPMPTKRHDPWAENERAKGTKP
jgi:hypothetical protein